jgi:hypothetical protein
MAASNDDGPGDGLALFAAAQPGFGAEEENAADERGPGHGRDGFGQLEIEFLHD